ncbi:hypothetical protein CDD83_8811 [Cordyceps sp. RAO-2017]|nr:hypothetical protein CDD83_8811 [Cordyceps sp. RAO-2017]
MTRIWLTDLSDALPANCELHGFDVSAGQYPPGEWLPENVSLHEHDAFAPFAPEMLGSFDVVNLRFFITLLNGENIHTLIRNLKTLLKPGGFLHWLDFDPRSAKAISIRPDVPMPRTESVVSIMRNVQPDLDLWISHGSDLFELAGLDPITYERIQLRKHLRPLWNDCHIMGMEELSRRMIGNSDGDADIPSPLRQEIKNLGAEFAQGSSIDAQWFMMVGQMPGGQQ